MSACSCSAETVPLAFERLEQRVDARQRHRIAQVGAGELLADEPPDGRQLPPGARGGLVGEAEQLGVARPAPRRRAR